MPDEMKGIVADLEVRIERIEREMRYASRVEEAIQVALQRIDQNIEDAKLKRAEMADDMSTVRRVVMGDDGENGLRSEFKSFRQLVIGVVVVIAGLVPVLALLVTLIQAIGK